MSYMLFAETAFHHEGDYDYMISLIDAASCAGCEGVKFQVILDQNNYMVKNHSMYDKVKLWLFNEAQWRSIIEHANNKKLSLILMPCESKAAEFLTTIEQPINYFNIHTVCFFDNNLLSVLKKTGMPIMLSTGGLFIEELAKVVDFFKGQDIVMMIGFQSFPSHLADVKLNRIKLFCELFKNVGIGYADHSSYNDEYAIKSLEFAYLLGARYFEKHITLDEGTKRVDYESAVGIEKLKIIKGRLDSISGLFEDYLSYQLEHSEEENKYRNRQKIVVAKRNLKPGIIIKSDDVMLKVTDTTKGFNKFESVIGRVLKNALSVDDIITTDSIK